MMDRPEDRFIPLGVTPEKSEYVKLSEHLSVLGLERDHFANQMGVKQYHEDEPMQLLLRGQAQIMGALAIFARDYDPMLGVFITGDPPPMNEDLIFKGGGPEIVAAMHAQMDRMTMDDLRLPEPQEGHRWRLWTGAGASATPGDPFAPGRPTVRVRLRDGRVHALHVRSAVWEHNGGPVDILAYEERVETG